MERIGNRLWAASAILAQSINLYSLTRIVFYVPVLGIMFLAQEPLCAQQQSGQFYFQEALKRHALPNLPYVCFRTSMAVSTAPDVEIPVQETMFVMLGRTKQIAELIRAQHWNGMDAGEREKFKAFEGQDSLYTVKIDHGIEGSSQIFDRVDRDDPSAAKWSRQVEAEHTGTVNWTYNINWGTLRFIETAGNAKGSLIYYGKCEAVPYSPE